MDRLTANRYIALQQKIESSGGGVPQELVEEVNALDTTVNGDETQDPPVVGLVDVVGDLGDTVEDLDADINGDDTTDPPTPGLKDRVSTLETTVSGLGGDIVRVVTPLTDVDINTAWGSMFVSASLSISMTNYSNYDLAGAIFVATNGPAMLVPTGLSSNSFSYYLSRPTSLTVSGDIILLLKKKSS